LHVCEENDPEVLHIKPQYDKLKAINEKMETVFVTARGNVLTQDIVEQDDNRDDLFNGFKQAVQAYLNHFIPEKIEAAKYVYAHIKKYGSGITDLNYNAETSILTDLIDGIETNTDLTAHVNLLGISDWLTEIKASNIEFNRIYELRAKHESKKSTLNLSELRIEAINDYRELMKYFEAASIMHPAPVYEEMAKLFNQFIDKYNNLRRKGNNGDDEGEGGLND